MIKYRADIDGLRAIAVLAVVIFHGFPNLLPGGFIGVDIFYVISGFLISSIILKNLGQNRFSFIEFYLHRTRRIFPALILVLITVLVYGCLRMQPDEFNQLLKHASSGAFFISNFTYLSDSGYFDTASEVKPLLHLWSLAIEEQFYLFWPVLIYFSWKSQKSVPLVLTLVTLGSFYLNIHDTHVNLSKAFYLPAPRFWELFAGVTLAFISRPRGLISNIQFTSRAFDIASISGLVLITIGLFFISNRLLFPGWFATIPVLGAVLLIFSGNRSELTLKFLSHPLLVWVGLISYPLYLWHWPIFAFLRIEFSGTPSPMLTLLGIALSIFLAWLTYRFIEKPIRSHLKRGSTVLLLAIVLFSIGAGSFYFYKKNVLLSSIQHTDDQDIDLSEKNQFYSYYADMPKGKWGDVFEKYFRHDCNFFQIDEYFAGRSTKTPKPTISESCYRPTQPRRHLVLIWGDSHAQMLYFGLNKNLPQDWQVLQVASSGCTPSATYQAKSETDYCAYSNWFAMETIKTAHPEVVIVAQSEGHEANAFRDIAKAIIPLGVKKLLVIGPSPHWTDDLPKIVIRSLWKTKPERTMTGVNEKFISLNKKLNDSLKKDREGIEFVDMQNLFCSSQGCLTRIGSDFSTNLTSWDYGHLTPIASDFFAKQVLARKVIDVLKPSPSR